MLSPITIPSWSETEKLKHGFFTREGGVSTGAFGSLNCRYGSDDSDDNVSRNRDLVARQLDCQPTSLVVPYQVHSARAIIATEPWSHEDRPQADALVTATPGICLGILTADCTPVLFLDPKSRVIGAAHAGWRGAKAGVLEATITKMEELGATREGIEACVGPTISAPTYEVGPEFEQEFLEENPDYSRFFHIPDGNERAHFDLPAYVMHRLAMSDIATIHTRNECTYSDEGRFFSFRRSTHQSSKDYGCQISAIVLQ